MKEQQKPRQIVKKTLLTLVVLLVIFAGVMGACYMRFLQRQVDALGVWKTSSLILMAVDNLNEPLPVDAVTGRSYIAAARLTLPMQSAETKMLYRHDKPVSGKDYDEEIRFIDAYAEREARSGIYNAQNIKSLFDAVPKLQACARGYLLRFKPLEDLDSNRLLFQKTLKDNRQIYIYAEDACNQTKDVIEPYLKQIESY